MLEFLLRKCMNFLIKNTPKGKISKQCQSCSLKNMCIPDLNKKTSVNAYIKRKLTEDNI